MSAPWCWNCSSSEHLSTCAGPFLLPKYLSSTHGESHRLQLPWGAFSLSCPSEMVTKPEQTGIVTFNHSFGPKVAGLGGRGRRGGGRLDSESRSGTCRLSQGSTAPGPEGRGPRWPPPDAVSDTGPAFLAPCGPRRLRRVSGAGLHEAGQGRSRPNAHWLTSRSLQVPLSLGLPSLPCPPPPRGRLGRALGRPHSPLGPGSPSSPVGPRYPGGPRAPG